MALSIILAEDHKLFRNGLRQLLEQEPDFRIVGEADNGLEAQRLVAELHPDLLILDLSMPGGSGLDAIVRVRKLCPHTKILIISMHDSAMHVRSAFQEGAHGYLLKTADSAEFFFAVRALAEGRQYVSSELTERMVAWSLSPEAAGPPLARSRAYAAGTGGTEAGRGGAFQQGDRRSPAYRGKDRRHAQGELHAQAGPAQRP